MHDDMMVHRANSIAQFFSAYPHEEAVAGVANHIQRFWEPRMRRHLREYLEGGGAELHALVVEAVGRLPGAVAAGEVSPAGPEGPAYFHEGP